MIGVVDRPVLAPGEIEAHRDDHLGPQPAERGGQVAPQRHPVLHQPVGVVEELDLAHAHHRGAAPLLLDPQRPDLGRVHARRCRPRPAWPAGRRPSCPARSSGPPRRPPRTRGRQGARPRPRRWPSPRVSAASFPPLFSLVGSYLGHHGSRRRARASLIAIWSRPGSSGTPGRQARTALSRVVRLPAGVGPAAVAPSHRGSFPDVRRRGSCLPPSRTWRSSGLLWTGLLGPAGPRLGPAHRVPGLDRQGPPVAPGGLRGAGAAGPPRTTTRARCPTSRTTWAGPTRSASTPVGRTPAPRCSRSSARRPPSGWRD